VALGATVGPGVWRSDVAVGNWVGVTIKIRPA